MFLPSYNYVLCIINTEETLEYLFLQCPFAEACWGLIDLQVPNQTNIFLVIESFKSQQDILWTLLSYFAGTFGFQGIITTRIAWSPSSQQI